VGRKWVENWRDCSGIVPALLLPRGLQNLGVGRASADHLVQLPCQSRVTYSRSSSRWVLNIAREGDSAIPLGSLFECSVTLKVKKFYLVFRWNFLCFSLCPLPLVLLLGTTEESGPILLTPTLEIFLSIDEIPSQLSLLQAKQAQLPQLFLMGKMLQSPHHLCSPPLDSVQ